MGGYSLERGELEGVFVSVSLASKLGGNALHWRAMLLEKPWRPDLVLRLFMALFFSMLLGVLIVSGYQSLMGDSGKGGDFLVFVVGVFSFHGIAFVLVDVFLRQHNISWGEAFGFTQPRLGRAVYLAVVFGIVILPIAWSLMRVSVLVLEWAGVTVEPQAAIRVMETLENHQLVWHGLATVLVAPFAEELIFRGILYPAIKQHGYHKLALWGTSLIFALIHGSLALVVPLTVLAILLTLLYETTNNLISAIIAHSLFNAVNFFILVRSLQMAAPPA